MDLFRAAKHILANGQSDLYPKHNVEGFSSAELAKRAAALIELEIVKLPKPEYESFCAGPYKYRNAAWLDPVLATLYLGIALELGERSKLLPSNNIAFSYRLYSDGEEIFDPSINWAGFQIKALSLAAPRTFVISLDLANFYASFTLKKVQNSLSIIPDCLQQKATIERILGCCEVDLHGLPVGGDASRILAELTLSQIDTELGKCGIKFCRFVDDYRIICADLEAANAAILVFQTIVTRFGFAMNAEKTRIESAELYHELNTLSDRVSLNFRSDEQGNQWRIEALEDPYSASVIDKISQLENEADIDSVAVLIEKETQKIAPSQRNLGTILRACLLLPSGQPEAVLCKLIEALQRPVFFPLLPKLVRVIARMCERKDFDSGELHGVTSLLLEQLLNSTSTPTSVLAQVVRICGLVKLPMPTNSVNSLSLIAEQSSFLARELTEWHNASSNNSSDGQTVYYG